MLLFQKYIFKLRKLKWKICLQHTTKTFLMGVNPKTKEKRVVDNVNFTRMTLM